MDTAGRIGGSGLGRRSKTIRRFQKQALDAALVPGKSSLALCFNEIASQSWNPIVKGWTLGMSDRLIDVGLTRHTYTNENGDVDQNSLKAVVSKHLPAYSAQNL